MRFSDPGARVTLGARIFGTLAIAAPILWYRDRDGLVALGALVTVWAVLSVLDDRGWLADAAQPLEAVAIGLICGIALDTSPSVLVALTVPPFVASISGGLRAGLVALSAELTTSVGVALVILRDLTVDQSLAIVTWMFAAAGLTLVGQYMHGNVLNPTDALAPYLDAQRLIRQLLDLSDDLSSGLDVPALAGAVLSDTGDLIPTVTLAIYAPRQEILIPLAAQGSLDGGEVEPLAVECWTRKEPLEDGGSFAFPLGTSVVVAGALSPSSPLTSEALERVILDLMTELRTKAVQLDTALLFSEFRDAASADVRRRLAREMHDGVAQDIASLGYLVDALAAKPASEKQAEQFARLRERITAIVAEVRQSVLTLRTSIGESESLGAAISTVARHLSESSQIPIAVTLDEHATRLRPEVEAELFRITQEAMNNAIKHARCTAIDVVCSVQAPRARITVSDDGRGMQTGRSDSHGLKIMRERARLIGAELAIDTAPAGGLRVTVSVAG